MSPITPELSELLVIVSAMSERLGHGVKPPSDNTLYHYTDSAGFLGIVDSGELWATHYAYLNDSSEFKYASGLLREVIDEVTAGAAPDSPKGRMRQVMLQSGDVTSHGPEWTVDPNGRQQFVACFSEAGDGLSQWRGYGKSIGGYALGFPFHHLRALADRQRHLDDVSEKTHGTIEVNFRSCWYDVKAQRALIREVVDQALSFLERSKRAPRDSWIRDFLVIVFHGVSPWFKDPAFGDEREWRLVVRIEQPFRSRSYGGLTVRTSEDLRPVQMRTVRFRRGEYSLVPYVVVPVVLDAPLCLSQVVVGPTPLPENARAAAIQLLSPLRSRKTRSSDSRKIVCDNVINTAIPFRRV